MRGGGSLVAALVAAGTLAGCTGVPKAATSVPSAADTPYACPEPASSPLPEWARTGFSPPDQPVAHLVSEQGLVVAVPFGWPLRERQPEGRANKVLWVAQRYAGGPMLIEARRQSDTAIVRRELPQGPGPSTIDLPGHGCWRLDLTWSGVHDRIYLRYLGPAD